MIDSETFLNIKSRLLRPSEISLVEKAMEQYGEELVAQGGLISMETCEWIIAFIANKKRVLSLGVKEPGT